MLGKIKTVSLLTIFVLVSAAVVSAAPSYINKLGLSRDGSFTVLTIGGSDQLRVAHQSIEAKEGRPFRIVVDCLASRHDLPQKEYDDLPGSIITSIRTSQYSVSPEEVVRVVMDLNEESIYRVETDNNVIRVLVSDQNTAPFADWSSKTAVSKPMAQAVPSVQNTIPKTNPEKMASTNQQQAAKINTEKLQPVAKTTTAKPKTITPSAPEKPQPAASSPVRKPSVVNRNVKKSNPASNASPYVAKPRMPNKNDKYGPVLATTASPQPIQESPTLASQENPKAKPEAPVKAKAEVEKITTPEKPVPENKQVIKQDLARDTIEKGKVFAALANGSAKVPDPGVNTGASGPEHKDIHKNTPAAETKKPAASQPNTKPAETVVNQATPPPAPVNKNNEVVLASIDKAGEKPAAPTEEEVKKIRTSKYRRESAKSAEIKASQVVQFPQRMVIKYQRPGQRDPFESLITVEKKKGNVDLNKVPNVEALNLVGILEPESGKGAALMEDLDGIGYILHPGDRVQNGYVAQVDKTAVYFQINEYGWGRTVVKHMDKEN